MRSLQWAILAMAVGGLWTACSRGGETAASDKERRTIDLELAEVPSTSVPAPNEAPAPPEAPEDDAGKGKPMPPTSSLAAVVDPRDTLHLFVRNADVRCRVADVVRTTYAVEAIVRRHGGYVAHTDLRTSVGRQERIPLSADSAVERSLSTVTNTLRIRVPDDRLDSTLLALAPLVEQLDHRVVEADDVKLQLLAERMKQQRLARHNTRLSAAVDNGTAKLRDRTEAENDLLTKEEQRDEALIAQLALRDRVAFATVTLDLYRPETLTARMVPLAPPVEPWRPGFQAQAVAALADGWGILRGLVVVLITLWPLALIALIVWVVLKRWRPRAVAA